MDRQEIKGKGKKVEGEIEKAAGRATGNPDLEAEGEADRAEGEVREGFGKARRKANEALDDVEDAFDEP